MEGNLPEKGKELLLTVPIVCGVFPIPSAAIASP